MSANNTETEPLSMVDNELSVIKRTLTELFNDDNNMNATRRLYEIKIILLQTIPRSLQSAMLKQLLSPGEVRIPRRNRNSDVHYLSDLELIAMIKAEIKWR